MASNTSMIDTIKKVITKHQQLIKYGFIGCLCATLDFISFTILSTKLNLPIISANIISVNIGIISSFILNREITFKVKNKTALRFFSFYSVGLVGLAISSFMLIILVNRLGFNKIYSKAVTIIIVALIQFILNKYITFKQRTKNG